MSETQRGNRARIGNGEVLWEVAKVWPDGTVSLVGISAYSRVRGQRATSTKSVYQLTWL